MQIILTVLLVFTGIVLIILVVHFRNKNRKKKLRALLKANWGKQVKTDFAFSEIELYHKTVKMPDADRIIGSEQIADLNLHAVFMQLDRTTSKCGQQYLYHRLLCPAGNTDDLLHWDEAAEYFAANPRVREEIQVAFSLLKKQESYYLPALIFNPPGAKPGYLSLVPALILFMLFTVVMLFFDPSYIIVLVIVMLINFILHNYNKNKIKEYIQSFKSLQKLFDTARLLAAMKLPVIETAGLAADLKTIKPLRKFLSIINMEPESSSDYTMPFTLLTEFIKILFLLDLLAFYRSLKYLVTMTDSIHNIYRSIGFTDSTLATAAYRAGLPYYTKPVFTAAGKQLVIEKMYHPLVPGCVANSLEVKQRSILITGSNMSGKTTFIRTAALNALFARTICTCLAARYEAPFLKVLSSIVIADNITEGKSYYFKELERLLVLIHAADKAEQCLFILDECFKGTNTIERIAAAREVLSYLNRGSHIVLIATHDLELSELLKDQYELYHFTEIIRDDTLSFDYQLKPGILETRNAIKLLALSGYPRQIVEAAEALSRSINFLKQG